jgi:hypothetical protein
LNILGLFVKQPVPGRVKTRLAAEIGAERAAELSAAFIADLVARFRTAADRRVLCYAPATEEARRHFESIAGTDFELWPQPETNLGERLARCFALHLRQSDDRVVVIGSDSPTLPLEHVERAFELLGDADCVLGPATDGGYYLVGQRGRCRPIFDAIDWSTPRVLEQTVTRIADCGASLALLPPWYDVDTPDDLRLLAGHLRALQAAGGPLPIETTRLVAASPV